MTLPQLLYAYTCIPEVGPASLRRIMDSFSNPDEAWTATSDQLQRLGLKPQTVFAINDKRSTINALSAWQELVDNGIQIVTIEDNDYPPLLAEIHAPPPLLTYRGTLPTKTCVAIVGTRRCTRYGLDVAKQLAQDLTQAGITVVSGLALGIDTAAHLGVLESKGQTTAIVGTGLSWNVMYPAEHRDLAKDILKNNGCIISEHSLQTVGLPGHFPRRNRIVSGLCKAVVVVEAGEKSGAILTAHLAVEQNREVLAVPGLITSPASIGTNKLIKSGAAVVTSVTDILEAIGLTVANPYPTTAAVPAGRQASAVRPLPPLSESAQRLYEMVTDKGTSVDQLGQQLGLKAADLAMTITELELEGLVRREGSSVTLNLFQGQS